MTAHRVHRTAHFRRYPPKTEAMLSQDLDFHILLIRDHRRLKAADLLNRCINFQSPPCINLQLPDTEQMKTFLSQVPEYGEL